MNFILVPLIVFTLIISPISAKNKCNDDCLTKTYCLSTSGSNSCSEENLFKATWSASQQPNRDVVTLVLTAENVKSSEMRTLSLVFKSAANPSSLTNYTCYKSAIVVKPTVTHISPNVHQTISTGVSSLSGGILSCSWSFSMYDGIWPLYFDHVARLIDSKSGIIELGSQFKSVVVAQDVSELPIYQLQYLSCCNKIHGNGDYKVIFNQTSDNKYTIRTITKTSNQLTLTLNNTNGKLIFNCDFTSQKINSFVVNKTQSTSITNLLYGQNIYCSYDSTCGCYWSHPLLLSGSFGKLDTTNGVFDITLVSDGTVVYTEKEVKLKNSASKLISFISIIFTIISVSLSLSYH